MLTYLTWNPSSWRSQAACGRNDPRLLDPPEPNESPRAVRARIRQGNSVCRGCPGIDPCLREAVALGDVGFRGGVLLVRGNQSAAKPQARLVERHLPPCGTYAAWRRHRRNGEPTDAACAGGHTTDVARYRHARRTADG